MKLKKRLRILWKKSKRFYALYTSGLTRGEIEQLLKKDTVGALTYFKSKTNLKNGAPTAPPHSTLKAVKAIFISFIMQLTPARRLCYCLGLIGFAYGLFKVDYGYLIGSFLVLNFLLALELVDKLTTRDELEIAREIQLSLQPDQVPKFSMLSIASFYQPAKVVGGDFFDIVPLESNQMISVVGDVSGKGISAALYAAYFQSMFHSLSESNPTPFDLMKGLNHMMGQRLRDGDFITAVVARFNFEEKSVTIARAGHNWPLYYSARRNTITELKPRGVSIGLFENDQFMAALEEEKIYLDNGDLLLFYSDGITEATSPGHSMFEVTGLKEVVEESVHETSQTIVSRINERVYDFVESDALQDDATLLAFKIE